MNIGLQFTKLSVFERLVFIFTLIQVLYLILLFYYIVIPVSLLYGPFLLAMYRAERDTAARPLFKGILPHLIPFVVLFLWLSLNSFSVDSGYFITFLCLVIPSLIIYPIYVLRRLSVVIENNNTVLLRQLIGVGSFISTFLILKWISTYTTFRVALDVDPIYVIALALIFSLLLTCFFLVSNLRTTKAASMEIVETYISRETNSVSILADHTVNTYFNKLTEVMEKDLLFLDRQLSFDKFAKYTSITKNDISEVLSRTISCTYYEWVASYRVEFALKLLQSRKRNMKLEVLAESSGFNSKATFNRYFKEIVGVNPSNYRRNLMES